MRFVQTQMETKNPCSRLLPIVRISESIVYIKAIIGILFIVYGIWLNGSEAFDTRCFSKFLQIRGFSEIVIKYFVKAKPFSMCFQSFKCGIKTKKGFPTQGISKSDLYFYESRMVILSGCNEQISIDFPLFSNVNVEVSYCSFMRLSELTGDGGIIFINDDVHNMIISYSMFDMCTCSRYGGAIYFKSMRSELRKICASRCFALGSHLFAMISTTQTGIIESLSLTKCSQTTEGSNSIALSYGNQRFDDSNSSLNLAASVSGLYVYSPSSFSSSRCTFSNNYVSSYVCIKLYQYSGTFFYIIVVSNNSPSHGIFTMQGNSAYQIKYGILYNNQGTLFSADSGTISLFHSYIQHSGLFSSSTIVSTSANNSFQLYPTYQYQYFLSGICHADNPISLEEPTPVQTIYRSYEDHPPVPTVYQTLFPHQTPHQSLFPHQTPHQSLFPHQTPHQSLFPHPTPHQSLFPPPSPPQTMIFFPTLEESSYPNMTPDESNPPYVTPHRSYPEEQFLSSSDPFSNQPSGNNQMSDYFLYSTYVLSSLVIILIMIMFCCFKKAPDSSSSLQTSEQDHKIENPKGSSPYIF